MKLPQFVQAIFARKTPERLVGGFQIALGLTFLAYRPPTPATLSILQTVYGLVVTSVGIGVVWLVFGLILFWKKRVGRKTFVFLFAPTLLYTASVLILVLQVALTALPLALMAVGFCYFVLRDYARRATMREELHHDAA